MTRSSRWTSLSVAVVLAVTSAPLLGQSAPEVARAYREAHEAEILRDYAELLTYPNRAGDLDAITRTARFIRDELRSVGVDSELWTLQDAPPIVFGEIRVPDAERTLGIYVHYDGQAVDPSNWTHPPFEPTLYSRSMLDGGEPRPFPEAGEPVDPEWRVYARSASDDKAPIGALLAVLRSFQEEGIAPTSNLVFFLDGEEEAGSPHMEEHMRRHRERLDPVDIWLFFDGPAHPSGRPVVTFGVRGAGGMEITVYGAVRSLHSGHYGNWAPDTGNILAHLLASMKDRTGRVTIDGWYDNVEPLGPEARAALEAMPDWDDELKRELGLAWTEGEPETLQERLLLPALNVRGITSGNTGELARNVIPNTAVASLGIRLVEGNDPERLIRLVEDHIADQGFHIVREDPDMETRLAHERIVKIPGGGGGVAARTSMANPYAQQVLGAAREAADRAFGEGSLVVSPGMGGTLPLTPFTEFLDRPAIVVSVANHDNNQHAPDENLRIANLWYAIDLYASLLSMGGG